MTGRGATLGRDRDSLIDRSSHREIRLRPHRHRVGASWPLHVPGAVQDERRRQLALFTAFLRATLEAYHAARAQALTPKYRLQDYGGTLLTLGVSVAVLSWRPLKAPASSLGFIAVALPAPSASVGALVFDLVQGQSRWAFPPWADFWAYLSWAS